MLYFYLVYLINMSSSKNPQTPENLQTPSSKKNKKIFSWLKKVTAAVSLLCTACDGNFPNKEVIVNPSDQYEKFNVEYQFSEWSAGATIVDYNIVVHKDGDKYYWDIVQTDWRFKEKKGVEAKDLDWVFDEISRSLDTEQITDDTKGRKDKKVAFAKQVFKDSIENNKNPSKGESRIKYNPKQ